MYICKTKWYYQRSVLDEPLNKRFWEITHEKNCLVISSFPLPSPDWLAARYPLQSFGNGLESRARLGPANLTAIPKEEKREFISKMREAANESTNADGEIHPFINSLVTSSLA